MAIDTRQKRESSFGICLPFGRVLPTPDGSDADGEDERTHLAMNYNGIATVVGGVTMALMAYYQMAMQKVNAEF